MGLDERSGTYVLRRSDGAGDVVVDVARLAKDEVRLVEMSAVNQAKAPELLSHLNAAYGRAKTSVAELHAEKLRVAKALKEARSDATLLYTDKKVKEMGFEKSSKDIRDALIDKDPQVSMFEDRSIEVQSVLSHVQAKADTFYQAIASIRSVTQRWPNSFGGQTGGQEPAPFTLGRPSALEIQHYPNDDESIPPIRY